MQYVAHEWEADRLRLLHHLDIIMAVGREDRFIQNNRDFSGLLWSKGIGNALREWDGWAHDWPYWQKMVSLYISGHD
jgi:esterase/lipase superfamily enzyme